MEACRQGIFEVLRRWASDGNYHVRRLASEGIRPFLPWAARVVLSVRDVVAVLDTLYADPTRYVTRSVANNLNDLSRIEPDAVLMARFQVQFHDVSIVSSQHGQGRYGRPTVHVFQQYRIVIACGVRQFIG